LNSRRADLSPRELAMLDFAVKVATTSHALCNEDFEALLEHGFSDEDTWDIGAITAFFAHGSRMANLTMRPNAEFYALGRSKPEQHH
ncbi:MAG: alkylhydroperoxidase, partial [Bradyrhizobium sp.]|nr:alkylhydroperoxidase [Bradyrhizobium sp.]